MRSLLLLAFLLCSPLIAVSADDDLELLASHMQGAFSSKKQSEVDTTYFHVVLHMKRIWHDREDGIWLYVEQAMATSPEKPYRQRVYRLRRYEGRFFESAVFTLNAPANVIGGWKDTTLFDALTPSDLTARKGCEVYLRKTAEGFTGGTEGMACASDLRGAAYATSEVTITPQFVLSWDRGFDNTGKQVWGATEGPYVFLRESS
jgi:hypothetical protein